MFCITLSDETKINRNASKGNQLKWKDNETWYKADFLGYEALSEHVVSKLLQKTNAPEFVKYDIVKGDYQDKLFTCSKSDNFLRGGYSLVTLPQLFSKYLNDDIYGECERLDRTEEDCIKYIVENVKQITGLESFGEYLTFLFEMDAFFLNEDRHFNNIAVLYNETEDTFDYCPIFDNGAALFSDMQMDYDLSMPLEQCYRRVNAKPISPNFEDQIKAAANLYGTQFKYWFTKEDIEQVITDVRKTNIYSEEILSRVNSCLCEQIQKFSQFQLKEEIPIIDLYKENIEKEKL